ncbi:MAG: hypothetical protein ISS70_15715 [Phycisphaerae bacterium]|nr:hypothetical protein [Phycisphaerae bacterium]
MNTQGNNRREFLESLGFGAAILAGSHWLSAGERTGRGWLVGYAEADITPAPGQCFMSGFGRERYAQSALSPLLCQVLAIQDHKGRVVVLVTADLLAFDRTVVEGIRHDVKQKHGIEPECVMFAASHTHWAPAVSMSGNFGCIGAPNVWYMGHLEETILSRIDDALKNLTPAAIEYTALDFRGIGYCRRLPVNGKIIWGPYPEGSFDGHTPILRVRRQRSPQQLLIVGHACHPTSSGRINMWSPDYPGAMRDTLSEQMTDTKALFVQGCGGDAKIFDKDPETGKLVFAADPKRAKAAGQELAQAVISHLDKGQMTPLSGAVNCSLVTGQLSYGKSSWSLEEIKREAYKGPKNGYMTWTARQYLALPFERPNFRYDVQLWKFGRQLTVFGMEGEVCSPWGPMLRSMSETEQAMVVGYANSTNVYIPDRRIVREGGYEGSTSHRSYFQPGPFTENINKEVKHIAGRALDKVK